MIHPLNFPSGHGSDTNPHQNPRIGDGGFREEAGAIARSFILPEPKGFATVLRNAARGADHAPEAGAAAYLRYAEGYNALAEQRERLARDAAELNINNNQQR